MSRSHLVLICGLVIESMHCKAELLMGLIQTLHRLKSALQRLFGVWAAGLE